MKSGLEGRNNKVPGDGGDDDDPGLNEVRPRRPEQLKYGNVMERMRLVSMKSGLEGRNNPSAGARWKKLRFSSQ